MHIRHVQLHPHAVLEPIGLNAVHVIEALTTGFAFAKAIERGGEQTLCVGYGYSGFYLSGTVLRLRRGNAQDDSFLRIHYIQQGDVALVFEAHEAEKWEIEEYGTEF